MATKRRRPPKQAADDIFRQAVLRNSGRSIPTTGGNLGGNPMAPAVKPADPYGGMLPYHPQSAAAASQVAGDYQPTPNDQYLADGMRAQGSPMPPPAYDRPLAYPDYIQEQEGYRAAEAQLLRDLQEMPPAPGQPGSVMGMGYAQQLQANPDLAGDRSTPSMGMPPQSDVMDAHNRAIAGGAPGGYATSGVAPGGRLGRSDSGQILGVPDALQQFTGMDSMGHPMSIPPLQQESTAMPQGWGQTDANLSPQQATDAMHTEYERRKAALGGARPPSTYDRAAGNTEQTGGILADGRHETKGDVFLERRARLREQEREGLLPMAQRRAMIRQRANGENPDYLSSKIQAGIPLTEDEKYAYEMQTLNQMGPEAAAASMNADAQRYQADMMRDPMVLESQYLAQVSSAYLQNPNADPAMLPQILEGARRSYRAGQAQPGKEGDPGEPAFGRLMPPEDTYFGNARDPEAHARDVENYMWALEERGTGVPEDLSILRDALLLGSYDKALAYLTAEPPDGPGWDEARAKVELENFRKNQAKRGSRHQRNIRDITSDFESQGLM